MKAKFALGRGLDSLLGDGGPEARRVLDVEIHRLKPNPRQPRDRFDEGHIEELARSITSVGIIQPITVRPADGSYEIIAGERRWRAAQKAGLHRVPVIVREASDPQMLEMALVENLQREDLNPAQVARAYRLLVEDLELTQEDVARRVGKDRATVANTLRLLHLPAQALEALESGEISAGHAKALLSHRRKEEQAHLLQEILRRGLSVREAERYRPPAERGRRKGPDPDTGAATSEISRKLGVRAEIRRRGKGGAVVLHFRDERELERIYRFLVER